ncbi:MAG: hypothetical protein IJU40_07600 [Desulfovibrionaceae bacterium]|nr:hypothetical protein [Desulfovibrionaceae bacterium]
MSLTEILLSLAIMIAVVAGVALGYSQVKSKNDQQRAMQSIQMLRANIEQVYANGVYTDLSNEVLVTAGVVPGELLSGTSDIKTRWGDVTVANKGDSQYTITLENLDPQACRSIANLSTTSWAEVKVGEKVLYDRSENTTVNPSDLLGACSGATNTVVFTGP